MAPRATAEAEPLLTWRGESGGAEEPQPAGAATPPQPCSAACAPADGASAADTTQAEVLGECRICGEEALVASLDAPCGCRGGLRFVHRKCLQRWADEKGDLRCEICLQPFVGPYSAPPPRAPRPNAQRPQRVPVYRHDSGPLSAAEAALFAEELTRRFAAHAAAERRSSACVLLALTLLAVVLLQQAVATPSGGTESSSPSIYSAALFCLLCFMPTYCLCRAAAAARARAAGRAGGAPTADVGTAWQSADAATQAVPILRGRDALHGPRLLEMVAEARAVRDAEAARTEAAVIAYVDAAAARARAVAAARAAAAAASASASVQQNADDTSAAAEAADASADTAPLLAERLPRHALATGDDAV